jgi:hypothetical protein
MLWRQATHNCADISAPQRMLALLNGSAMTGFVFSFKVQADQAKMSQLREGPNERWKGEALHCFATKTLAGLKVERSTAQSNCMHETPSNWHPRPLPVGCDASGLTVRSSSTQGWFQKALPLHASTTILIITNLLLILSTSSRSRVRTRPWRHTNSDRLAVTKPWGQL